MLTKIKTIQLLDITIQNRKAFLFTIKKYVVEFALKKQELFLAMGYDAQYFHKDDQSKEKKPTVLIHSLEKEGFFSIRAYTQKGIDTLNFWFQLFQKEYPKYCINIIQSEEVFEYKIIDKPITYNSINWIPFRNVVQEKGVYLDKDKQEKIDQKLFISRLTANLLTFIGNLSLDTKTIRFNLKLNKVPIKHKSILALQTKEKGTLLNVKKYAFQVNFTINVQLPSSFSLGQNVAYGNGVFNRIVERTTKNEKKNPKSNKKT